MPVISYSCTRNHPLALKIIRAFEPLRGVATREMSAASSRYRTYEGVLQWRLLGALINGDARVAYSRRIVAPSSSLRPLSSARAPRLLSVVLRLCSGNRSFSCSNHQGHALNHRPRPSAPVHHSLSSTTQRSRRKSRRAPKRKPGRKRVWRLEMCDGALDFAPPHSAAGPRGPAAIA
jgi:hypothetical protein